MSSNSADVYSIYGISLYEYPLPINLYTFEDTLIIYLHTRAHIERLVDHRLLYLSFITLHSYFANYTVQ